MTDNNNSTKVLDEEEYLEGIERIIQRDFYPDLNKVKAELKLFESLNTNDPVKINKAKEEFEKVNKKEDSNKKKLTLDNYLDIYNSEDNDSFQKIVEKQKKQHETKLEKLFLKNDLPLMIEGNSDIKNIEKPKHLNMVMFNEETQQLQKEYDEASLVGEKQICYENTGFIKTDTTIKNQKKIIYEIPEGTVEINGETPNIRGYKILKTPNVDEVPIITYGTIEGTPIVLESEQNPFKIPPTPKREQKAMELVDKAKKDKKKLSGKNESGVSPALKRLLTNSKKRGFESSLRASYTPSPSPSHIKNTPKTPNINTTPNIKTPNDREPPKKKIKINSSITDDLLKL
jgi:protein DGCR14